MTRKIVETKHVYFCDRCESWYDRNDEMTTCSCGSPVRDLYGYEREEFYWRLSKSGYKIVPMEPEGRQA